MVINKIKNEVKKMNKEHIRELYGFYEDTMQDYILTDEVKKMTRNIIEETDILNANLSLEQQNMVQKIFEKVNDRDSEIDKEIFVFAFSLATKIFSESLNTNNI